jgi:glycosyltransferase involved in cell wall biosynthesis
MTGKIFQTNRSVLFVQPVLAHYRSSLFNELVKSEEFDIRIAGGGQNNSIKSIGETAGTKILPVLNNRKVKIAGHTFIWQGGLYKQLKKQKPAVVVLTGVDPHIFSSLVLSLFKKLLKVKIIWWGHATIDKQGGRGLAFRKFFFNCGDGIMTYSTENNIKLRKVLNKSIPVITVKNCINVDEYGFIQKAFPEVKRDSNGLTILFSGRLTSEKRVDILIKAIGILRSRGMKVRCVVIGDGVEYDNAVNLANSLGLRDEIEFAGAKYQSECIPYFRKADLFVLPGKVGLSIIHGLSYGLPVITSDKKEIHSPEYEIIKKGINGDFFSGFDEESLAEKIIEWKDKLKSNAKTIRDLCVQSILEQGYTVEAMSGKMIGFFRKIIANDAI